jgi:hypothetical protein
MVRSMFLSRQIVCDPALSKLISQYHPAHMKYINECRLNVFVLMK